MSIELDEFTLFSSVQIAERVKKIAQDIASGPHRPDLIVPILTGAFVFAADLLRALAQQGLDLETEFMWLRAYGGSQSPGEITVLKAPSDIVRGRTILLVDGVLDRGVTLAHAKKLLEGKGAGSIISAVAVVKEHPNPVCKADHFMFTAGPEFLYGYGMDVSGFGRGSPDIRIRRP